MDSLFKFIRSENELLDRQMEERQNRWDIFWHCFSSYESVLRIGSRHIISPVMTVERHKEMQILRKQACITEVRLKTKSREKEFLNRVERSLEEIQRETSEKEMSLGRRASLSESSQFTETSEHTQQLNNNNTAAVDTDSPTTGADTDSTVPGETILIKPVRSVRARQGSSRRSSSQSSRKESTSTQTSDSEDVKALIIVTAPKIHRRRRESGGSTGSEASASPADMSRHRSKSHSSVNSEPSRAVREDTVTAEHSTVRRTGSDGCKLRRSGSERALKRTGSDRVLRRTGSGDIPTAIMSDSTPRIHRRAGSGDMSHLHSNKQSAINKLTRSYDMSLRSLMSEELNVKVQPSTNPRDRGNNELSVEPVPGHNMLLSPKYSGGKDSAVKLLSRPAAQTIKKQTSPSKESGPPQPVKAIHTIPPSLPASRENTFDSLPQRSPLSSDSDVKDEKNTDTIEDTSEVTAGRTEVSKIKSSYHRRSPSPHRGLSSPHRNLSSPNRHDSSPRRVRASHTDGTSLPKETDKVKRDKVQVSAGTVRGAVNRAGVSRVRRISSTSDEEGSHPTSGEQAPVRDTEEPHSVKPVDSGTSGSDNLLDAVVFMESPETDKIAEERMKASDVWHLSHDTLPPSPDFLGLPNKLATSTESLAQQWLVDKVSQLHSSGQVNIEDWLQNAPDSVKQKLSQLLPRDRANRMVDSLDRHSPVDLSIDDTLRNTSPIPESEHLHSPFDRVNSPLTAGDSVSLPVTAVNGVSSPLTTVDRVGSPATAADEVSAPFIAPAAATVNRVNSPVTAVNKVNSPAPAEADEQVERSKSMFMRSNSYTLEKPSTALLLSEKLNRTNTSSSEFPTTMKFFPSPDRSSTLPSTHNRVEGRTGYPTNLSFTSDKSQASLEQPIISTNTQFQFTEEAPPDSPSAVERNRTIASKSYTVEKPSAALIDSLNESQKSLIESAVSALADTADELSTVSDITLKESATEPSAKPSVQRKLNYVSLSHLSSQTESDGVAYHSLKYDNPDVSKRAHIQRYLQQLKYADMSARKEAWSDSPNRISDTRSLAERSSTNHSSPGGESSRQASRESSSSPNKVLKQSEKASAGRRKSSPAAGKQTEDSKDVFNRVRRDLTLLKSKYAKKLSPRGSSSQRPSSAEPAAARTHNLKAKDHRPSTAAGHTYSHVHKQSPIQEQTTTDRNLSELKERLYAVTNKTSITLGSSHAVKSFAEKEATPISTGYVPPAVDDSISEYSSYGAIHSVSHPRPATALSPASINHIQTMPHPSCGSGAHLAALIRGHLCRRLFATSKVQSIVKTIRDCRSLLPQGQQPASGQTVLSLQDLNFQQRLLDQWQAALLDIHEIFFELSLDKRIALIHQSELMEAKVKSQQQQKVKAKVVRRTSNKEQQPPKRRISPTTQKVMDRKKVQKASAETSIGSKPAQTSTLKKAVLAPTFAANSPKRGTSSSTSSSRANINYMRQTPSRQSHDLLSRHTASKV